MQRTSEGFTRGLMSVTLTMVFLAAMSNLTSAQNTNSSRSAVEVLRSYRKLDAEGERLTVGGWYRASTFFVKPAKQPEQKVVAVMDSERIDDHPIIHGNRAEVEVPCSAVGQIDSSGRFTALVAPLLMNPAGRVLRQPGAQQIRGPAPLMRMYDLVLTDTHWEFGPGRDDLHQVKGAPEWRIETFEFEPWVTIEAGIRYLTQLRSESSSETIKNNAVNSIATLRRLRER